MRNIYRIVIRAGKATNLALVHSNVHNIFGTLPGLQLTQSFVLHRGRNGETGHPTFYSMDDECSFHESKTPRTRKLALTHPTCPWGTLYFTLLSPHFHRNHMSFAVRFSNSATHN